MRFCLYYWLIEPLRGGLSDGDERNPVFSHDIKWRDAEYKFGLYLDDSGLPEFGCLAIPVQQKGEIPDDAQPLITIIHEHLISTLRITWRDDARLYPMRVWRLWEDSESRKFNFSINVKDYDGFDPNIASAVFLHGMSIRDHVRLFVDGIDEHIPVQYRFLAFYKLLEARFKRGKRWDDESLGALLSRYKQEYKGSVLNRELTAELHDLRDKCAHIHTGHKKIMLGVTQLNHRESVRAHALLPVLRFACRDVINELAAGKFVLNDCVPWHERLGTFKAEDIPEDIRQALENKVKAGQAEQ